MTAPKLRFKEFDGNWKRDFVGTVISHKSKKFDPTKESRDLRCIELEHLSQNTGQIIDTVPAKDQKSIKNVFDENSILFGKLRPYLKKFAKPNFQGVCSSEIWVLTSKVLVPDFMFQYIQTDYFFELTQIQSGSKMPRADWESVSKGELGFPDRLEQTKIAFFLSAVDEKIGQLTQKYQLLSQYKQGMMQKLFSQQIRFKADDGSEFGEWEDKPLNEIASKRSGKNKDGSISEVLTNSATQGIIKQSDYFEREIVTESNLNGYYIVNLDDFVYNPRISVHAPVGPIKRNKKCLGVMSPLYTVFTVSEGNLAYLEYFFDSNFWHDYVKGVANSGARHDRMNITNKDFFDMPIFYPCLEEQTKIANFLSSIDQKIEVVAQQIEQAKTWKKGLLQQMFV